MDSEKEYGLQESHTDNKKLTHLDLMCLRGKVIKITMKWRARGMPSESHGVLEYDLSPEGNTRVLLADPRSIRGGYFQEFHEPCSNGSEEYTGKNDLEIESSLEKHLAELDREFPEARGAYDFLRGERSGVEGSIDELELEKGPVKDRVKVTISSYEDLGSS